MNWHKKLIYLQLVLVTGWCCGLGLRLSLFPPFPFNMFDRIFDFGVLFFIGVFNAIVCIMSYRKFCT